MSYAQTGQRGGRSVSDERLADLVEGIVDTLDDLPGVDGVLAGDRIEKAVRTARNRAMIRARVEAGSLTKLAKALGRQVPPTADKFARALRALNTLDSHADLDNEGYGPTARAEQAVANAAVAAKPQIPRLPLSKHKSRIVVASTRNPYVTAELVSRWTQQLLKAGSDGRDGEMAANTQRALVAMASHPECPAADLVRLSAITDSRLHWAILHNPKCPPPLKALLS